MTRRLRPLAALAVVAVIGAGCGGTSTSGGTTSTATPTTATPTTATPAAPTTTSPRTKAVLFSECMRANGVSGFPDPDATGALTIDAVANGSSVDTDSPAFEQALSACKELEPSGFTGHERTTEQQAAALRFAQCIRDHGVRDFPDPGAHDPLVDTRRIPSTDAPGGMDILNAAMAQCDASAAGVTGP
jgi:hypothetical protein